MIALAEARKRIEREREDGKLYATIAAHPSEEDRAWREARTTIAGQRWGSESE
jgi:hypothetical protein